MSMGKGSDGTEGSWGACFPLFGRLRRDASVEGLAGVAPPPPIVRPIQFTLVPESVGDFHDVANALRHCHHICNLLENQRSVIRYTYIHRATLITHLFTRVLPMPLPPGKNKDCFWASAPMRYETQADILRLLGLVV